MGSKRGTAKMKPKFTCGTLYGIPIDIRTRSSAWVTGGTARRARIGMDSCNEEQEKDKKSGKGQRREAAGCRKTGIGYPFTAGEGIAGQKPKG